MNDPKTTPSIDDDAVRARAYELWEADGGVHGRDKEHWFKAVTHVGSAQGVTASIAEKASSPDEAKPEAAPEGFAGGMQSLSTMAAGTIKAAAEFFGIGEAAKADDAEDEARRAEVERIEKLKMTHRSHHVSGSITDLNDKAAGS